MYDEDEDTRIRSMSDVKLESSEWIFACCGRLKLYDTRSVDIGGARRARRIDHQGMCAASSTSLRSVCIRTRSRCEAVGVRSSIALFPFLKATSQNAPTGGWRSPHEA